MDAQDWNARYAASETVWGAPPNPVIVEFATSLPRGRALDLGCGEGRHALWLATRGWDVVGVDFSRVAVDKARTIAAQAPRRVRERLTYVCADVTALSPDPEYDLVLAAYLHFPPPQRRALIDNAIAALKPEGTLIFLGHDSRNLVEGFGCPRDPEILFTPEDVVADIDGRLNPRIAERRMRETDAGMAIDALVVATGPTLGSHLPYE